jgi:uncharacterized protein YndB with AHSA1/START domain
MSEETLSFKQVIKTDPENAYSYFSNATLLRNWLCNMATIVPRPGGRVYLWWESGYYTSGEIITAVPGKEISFSWLGKGEPAQTQVVVKFNAEDDDTLVQIDHEGVGSGEQWGSARSEIEKGWSNALENLASVVASGEDLRFVSRPMLGIILDDFNEEIAEKLGLDSADGIRLGGTVSGMGAEAAGLIENDVLISMGGMPTTNFDELNQALNSHKAGETIEVVFYRDGSKQKAEMTLSGRPVPEIPSSAKEMAAAAGKFYQQIEQELEEFLNSVSEEEAAYKPSPSEWSIKENLAHFIQGERGYQHYIAELVSGYERFADDYGGNVDELLEATVSTYPTVEALFNEYQRNMAETLHFLANLPDEFLAKKGEYWRLAYGLLQEPYHFNSHMEQMQAALSAARGK